MSRRFTKNFIPLFNAFWYRDFPLVYPHKLKASRAEWTTHIGICVRSSADILGYFTEFEQGNRTDAVITDNKGKHIAHAEWEWNQPFKKSVNEIKKLYKEREEAEVSILISYSKLSDRDRNIQAINRQWKQSKHTLLVFLILYEHRKNAAGSKSKRQFIDLETYRCRNGKLSMRRRQPALPWNVAGTRWEDCSTPNHV